MNRTLNQARPVESSTYSLYPSGALELRGSSAMHFTVQG